MTVSDIIQEALENLGVLAAGETVSASDQASCLSSFKAMIKAIPGFGVAGGLNDVVVTTSPYTPKMNERILWAGTGSLTLNLPATVEGGLPPRNWDRVAVTSGGNNFLYIYIGSKAVWLIVEAITDDTDDPLGVEYSQALVDLLAYRVARKFQVPVTVEIQRDAAFAARSIARSKNRLQDLEDQAILN